MTRLFAVLAFAILFTASAFAHGNEKHVMGTISSISGNTITVETTAKKSLTVEVSDKTIFEKSGSAASLADLKVGDKVVIHAAQKGDKLVASKVAFGPVKSSMTGMNHKHSSAQPQQHP